MARQVSRGECEERKGHPRIRRARRVARGTSCLFFFFQAEDGIRDRTVTGVQTCALPISLIGLAAKNAILIVEFAAQNAAQGMSAFDAAVAAARQRFRPIVMTSLAFVLGVLRSEERRVGKEWRSRWVRYDEKKRV